MPRHRKNCGLWVPRKWLSDPTRKFAYIWEIRATEVYVCVAACLCWCHARKVGSAEMTERPEIRAARTVAAGMEAANRSMASGKTMRRDDLRHR